MPTEIGNAACHPERKIQARGLCRACYDKWLKENNPSYKIRQRGINADWCEKNPDKVKLYRERRKAKVRNDPLEQERVKLQKRKYALKQRFGITLDDYNALFKEQNGQCAICKRKPTARGLHLDHCHSTNKVRGFLCHQCNWYLGTLECDPANLMRLISYLHKHNSPALGLFPNE